jgi:hypothetical protein
MDHVEHVFLGNSSLSSENGIYIYIFEDIMKSHLQVIKGGIFLPQPWGKAENPFRKSNLKGGIGGYHVYCILERHAVSGGDVNILLPRYFSAKA